MKTLAGLLLLLFITTAQAEETAEPPFMTPGEKYIIRFADGNDEPLEIIKRKGDTDWYLVKGTGLISHTYYINLRQALAVTHLTPKKETARKRGLSTILNRLDAQASL